MLSIVEVVANGFEDFDLGGFFFFFCIGMYKTWFFSFQKVG